MKYPAPFCTLFVFLFLILSHQTFPQTNINTGKEKYSQFNAPIFENITIKDGLPENSVTCILQDYLGYLWLGTQNGLAQYDGYSMKVFQPEKDNNRSISNGGIVTLYEDKNKTLWIGTLNGLNKFDHENETFKSYVYNVNDTNSINSNQIHCIYEDRNGRFWVGTGEGLKLFDRKNEIFTKYYFREAESKTHSISRSDQYNLSVNAITEDPVSGDLLIGTEIEGLWRFIVKEKIFSKYRFSSDNNFDKKIGLIQSFHKARDGKIWMASNNTLSSLDPQKREYKSYIEFPIMENENYSKPRFVFGSVIEDQDGMIWSGFYAADEGVFCLNPANGSFLKYKLFPEKSKYSNFNKTFTLFEDRSGVLWIGTWLSGCMKFDKRKNKFQVLKSDPDNLINSLSHPFVYSLIYDPEGFIWFCTFNALDKYDKKSATYRHYLKNKECITQSPYTATQDNSGNIWLGTNSCGLIRFDPRDESYRFYFNNPNNSINLVNKQIRTIYQDQLGILWIGTNGFGLYRFDITKNTLTNFKNDPNDPSSLSQDQVRVIFEDRFGTLWVGTNLGGLNKFDRRTEKFSYSGLSGISAMYEDKQGNFWVADLYTGLNLFDREKSLIITSYGQKDGLASNYILRILEDNHNNLWIGTNNGLSKFNTETRTFYNYYKEDGLPDNEFIKETICGKSLDGEMYFKTIEGEIVFHPDSIKIDPTPPQVVLSGISLFNRPSKRLNYKGFISNLKEIVLPYNQNDLRFDYVGLHFSEPMSNKYKYFLENFDIDWIDAGNQRNAVYTNLDPGEYIFRVTASNKDGVWNEAGTSLRIIINPPLWKTTWAYLLYLLLIAGIIYFFWKAQLNRLRIKQDFEMSKFEAQKLHEVDEMKSRFFTNISHEFRTPLTLILGPVRQIIERIKDEKTKDELGLVHKNAKKLMGLVNQLLDISKLESGNMKLQAIPQNFIPLVKALVLSFTSYAERKRIALRFNSTEDEIFIYLDRDKIEKIITNILSNAFKFTPEGGMIEVSVNKEDKHINVIVNDTGTGILKEKISKVFDRFYQVDGSHTREQEGTGIGLSLTKELVELHRGKIEIESEEGKGTTVIISLPLGKDHLKPDEIFEPDNDEVSFEPVESIFFEETKTDFSAENKGKFNIGSIPLTENPLLLIVEDNSDVRNYIKDNLKKDYKVIEAVDGEDGWNKSVEQIPDLIVSDVMMPKIDGLKLCGKLKIDERTSHIPVILLTAKAAKEDKLEGYEAGADEYLMKPFEPDELRARIKNLIEQRKRLHEHFRKYGLVEIEEKHITPVDQEFLQKALAVINEHISDSSFGVEKLANYMAVSRSLLLKKIDALIGEKPVELIRRTRLNKAAKLIESSVGNISEIALEVGFSNPSYFAESFRKQFGVAPTQYHNKSANI